MGGGREIKNEVKPVVIVSRVFTFTFPTLRLNTRAITMMIIRCREGLA